jgi:di/tricarboxylate transporter
MSADAWIALAVPLVVFAVLQWRRDAPADLLFVGGLVAVTLTGVITPSQALAGFANPAVVTIGSLYIVAAGLRTTGVLDWIGNLLLGSARTATSALARLAVSVLGLSAFINNTPVVAMFVPVALDWCRRRGVSPSRMLVPISYLAILGGTCTLIGTSTNIIVNGLMREQRAIEARRPAADALAPQVADGLRDMTMFEIGRVGLPCALVGALYLLVVGRRLLPDRTELIERLDEQRREYLVETVVQPQCRLIGKTVEQAGLRHLRGLFLVEIDRGEEVITPVAPSDVIHEGDRLVFTGVVSTIVDLEKIPGLVPAGDLAYEIHPQQRQQRFLAEAVVSRSSPLVGRTVRAANFRRLYNAAVVAVHRNGARLPTKIGDIVLQPGDTLLLQTRPEFAAAFRNSRDFYLVAPVEGYQPQRRHRAWLAVGLMALLIVWFTASPWLGQLRLPETLASWLGWDRLPEGLASPAVAAMAVAGLMVVLRCLPTSEARSVIDLQVLVTIAAALGLGRALTESGAARTMAELAVAAIGDHPYVLLLLIYVLSVVFTELITNNAVAAMLFPLGVAVAAAGGFSPRPLVMAVAIAASLSFVTPFGYQTNLMVMGPGGYVPRDYLKVGWPLTLLVGATALFLIPRIWPFHL